MAKFAFSTAKFPLQKIFFKDSHNLHNELNTKAAKIKIRIEASKLSPSKTSQKDRSLRTIVNMKKQAMNIPTSQTDVETLVGGP